MIYFNTLDIIDELISLIWRILIVGAILYLYSKGDFLDIPKWMISSTGTYYIFRPFIIRYINYLKWKPYNLENKSK